MKKVRAKVRPEALWALQNYKDDLAAGHKDAQLFWRGAAGAYFTANPTGLKIDRIKTKEWTHGTYTAKGKVESISVPAGVYKVEKETPHGFAIKVKGTKGYVWIGKYQRGKRWVRANPFLESIATGLGLGLGFVGAKMVVGGFRKKNSRRKK